MTTCRTSRRLRARASTQSSAPGSCSRTQEATVAKKFPNTQFAITDYAVSGAPFNGQEGKLPENVTGLTYATQQSSPGRLPLGLDGEDKAAATTISVVGGVKIPPVDTFIAGYKAGAAKCLPGIKVLVGLLAGLHRAGKCKAVAQNQIYRGAEVVFAVAGPCGFGALAAAKEAGVWGDGVDVDQSYLGPHILTSAVKRVDLGVYLASRRSRTARSFRVAATSSST